MVRFSKLFNLALTSSVAQAFFAPATHKLAPSPTVLNVLGDARPVSTGKGDSFRRELVGHGSFDIFDLLLQRSLQTQIGYYKGTRNSLKADWLNGFASHSHLDDGSRWHSIVGMRVHCGVYFRELFAEPAHSFTVQYGGDGQLGLDSASAATPLASPLGNNADDAAPRTDHAPLAPHPDLMPWTAAASSRKRNPYLPKPQPLEFTEVVAPQELAAVLMGVCRAVASEFQEDLALQASVDNAEFRAEQRERLRARSRAARVGKKRASQRGGDDGSLESTPRLPSALEHGPLNDAEMAIVDPASLESIPPFEAAERGRSDPSTPLRRLNYELLQRAATILALQHVQEELARAAVDIEAGAASGHTPAGHTPVGSDAACVLEWLNRFLIDGKWWDDLAAVTTSLTRPSDGSDVALDSVSDRLLRALDLGTPSFMPRSPAPSTPPSASSDPAKEGNCVLIDPCAVADLLRGKREGVALSLVAQLKHTDEVLQAVVRESEDIALLERAVGEGTQLACRDI